MDEREQFIAEWRRDESSTSELCRRFGISRKTAYKYLDRYKDQGMEGLKDRSRAPVHHPNEVSEGTEREVVELRRAHPRWGPRKLRAWLKTNREGRWPAASTIAALLKREGLAAKPQRRKSVAPSTTRLVKPGECNLVWCADFKGWFNTLDGVRCDPLTMTDAHSRYLLRCQVVARTTTEQVRAIFEAAFREYGLPKRIRTDNGEPFAGRGFAGLSRLSVWWIKLGIIPERIRVGHPEENGRHERMHRTLKAETANPPAADRRSQQERFMGFQQEYNQERPHEALNFQTPARVYRPSPRAYPSRFPEMEYAAGMDLRRVRAHGQFSWEGDRIFLSHALGGEVVGLQPIDERYRLVWFGPVEVALFDVWKRRVRVLAPARE